MDAILSEAKTRHQMLLEHEAVVMAEEVLGTVPVWYLENKEIIEQNRQEMALRNADFTARLESLLGPDEKDRQ